jgi:DNA modification methylase
MDIKIENGDAMYLIEDIEDESIDLVILDPNYQDWDNLCEQGLICQAVRVLKPTGNIICFTKQPFDFNLRNEVNHIFRREFIWSFSNGGAWVSNNMPLVSFQKIYWLVTTNQFYFNPRTGLNYNENTKSIKRNKKIFDGYEADGKFFNKSDEGTWLRDHYHYNKPNCGKIPKKPEELLKILIKCLCPENGIVLDPFLGSGETAIQSINLKNNFIGYEINNEIYNIANKRINEKLNENYLFF